MFFGTPASPQEKGVVRQLKTSATYNIHRKLFWTRLYIVWYVRIIWQNRVPPFGSLLSSFIYLANLSHEIKWNEIFLPMKTSSYPVLCSFVHCPCNDLARWWIHNRSISLLVGDLTETDFTVLERQLLRRIALIFFLSYSQQNLCATWIRKSQSEAFSSSIVPQWPAIQALIFLFYSQFRRYSARERKHDNVFHIPPHHDALRR